MLFIYNTLTRKKEEFKPLSPGNVLMYQCGPTVYWTQHIGNMRAMVMADLVVRTLKYLGFNVRFVRNYTDVGHLTGDNAGDADTGEDKMERASKAEGLAPLEIAEKYIKTFEADIRALNVNEVDNKPRATEMIPEIIEMISVLIEKGYAYATDLAVYFDVSKAKNYNRLTGQNIKDQLEYAGKADVSDPDKKHFADFALWFFKAGKHSGALQFWPSPFMSPLVENGEGFPGWHIECSAMAKKFLGLTIDIHMGGIEHIPIHHTNEIAQSESANERKFAHYWMHNEHLMVNGGKMSKSEGSGYSVTEIIEKGFSPLSLRYFFLSAHYRSKQNFTWDALQASQNGINHLRAQVRKLGGKTGTISEKYKEDFIAKISDDFNIPQGLALAHDMLNSDIPNENKLATILDFDKIFGLNLDKLNELEPHSIEIPDEIKKLADERETARTQKNWGKADELRKKIEDSGWSVEDTDDRSVLKKT